MGQISPHVRMVLLGFAITLVLGCSAWAEVVAHQDDFETDKAMTESFWHTPFGTPQWGMLEAPPVLFYHPVHNGRALGFQTTSVFDGSAELEYRILPPGMKTTGGSVDFDFYGDPWPPTPYPIDTILPWPIFLVSWLGPGINQGTLGKPDLVGHYSLPIPAGLPLECIDFLKPEQGTSVIDNLKITVSYVPEPRGALLAIAGLALLRRATARASV